MPKVIGGGGGEFLLHNSGKRNNDGFLQDMHVWEREARY